MKYEIIYYVIDILDVSSKLTSKYVIIGSGIAGYHALKEMLNIDPKANITLVTSDSSLPYDRPPLSKEYMRSERDRDSLFFEKPEFYQRDNLKVMLNTTVERLNVKEKFLTLSTGQTLNFDKLLITTGGKPRKLGIHGENLNGVHYLRTLSDADSIKEDLKHGKKPVIVGAGFIGVEVAASLRSLGFEPVVIEVKPFIWSTFVDEKVSEMVRKYFENKGVTFLLNEGVKEFEGSQRVNSVITSGGKKIESSMVLVAVGISPNVEIANELQVNNGILVDEHLKAKEDIYVAGDVANILDPVSGKRRRIEHWNNAYYTGQLAARNMMGQNESYNFLSTVWSDIFDLHIESGGETTGYDDYVMRGNFDKKSLNVIYVKGGLVIGYVAFNRDMSELEAINKLIQDKVDIKSKVDKLKDESFDIRKLSS
ncbi:pyridine nucleotide-disulfide oxidoreductase [Sulfolobus acidocaldarius]|uniref:Pyridine nucleotide-disulphide oxidoreductase n=4 Tax=Sulfolobus acidocaldarius TaxID=2285 RepID=Q4J6K8_SULAC|nr:pyridine nucleotide-disulphide oxidoreductase [Sulfolobus acidocaldarius DSM 639]AGE72176.1 pyridine nucleotide-disulfide oxidoreductase [Sulfolobus acidocaldarius N8]AGE74493.1 pyridine nucleotide-disulfide oxidoreductase [Sulfolobus acidocaldarius Ron12/I]ALU29652.1 pyridine nucleotide-disulfide oxidoreductase [Sulfolobus acidocaldarius]ALU32387.1 pyridine nucleotide-disulfide oxidoreductase [Sulfolobus acidocaldarius]